jgi:hypothetical protein
MCRWITNSEPASALHDDPSASRVYTHLTSRDDSCRLFVMTAPHPAATGRHLEQRAPRAVRHRGASWQREFLEAGPCLPLLLTSVQGPVDGLFLCSWGALGWERVRRPHCATHRISQIEYGHVHAWAYEQFHGRCRGCVHCTACFLFT